MSVTTVDATPSVCVPSRAVTVMVTVPGEPKLTVMRRRFVPAVVVNGPMAHVYTTEFTLAAEVLVGTLASIVHTRAAQDDVSVNVPAVGAGVGVGVGVGFGVGVGVGVGAGAGAATPGNRCNVSKRLGVFGKSPVILPVVLSASSHAVTASGVAVFVTPR